LPLQVHQHENGRYFIRKGKDESKDQSYALWGLQQDLLSRTLLPLGTYHKTEIRQMAHDFGYPELAKKNESYEICFVPDNDYRGFLKRRVEGLEEKVDGGFFNKNNKILIEEITKYYNELIKNDTIKIPKILTNYEIINNDGVVVKGKIQSDEEIKKAIASAEKAKAEVAEVAEEAATVAEEAATVAKKAAKVAAEAATIAIYANAVAVTPEAT
jgi:hypothetical protein